MLQAAIVDIRSEIKILDEQIKHSEWRIDQGIEIDVHRDPQYWPWGIGRKGQKADVDSKGVPTQWSEEAVAKYFLGEHKFFQDNMQIKDPLPQQFREYADSAILAKNIFNKAAKIAFAHVPIEFEDGALKVKKVGGFK